MGTRRRESEGEQGGLGRDRRVVKTGAVERVGLRAKLFPLVGYVPVYWRFYEGRLGIQEGGSTSDLFWDV